MEGRKAFAPTAGMRRYAQARCRVSGEATEENLCKEAKLTVRVVARWRRVPGFLEWLAREEERLLALSRAEVWKEVLHRAKAGSIPAAKLFLERFGAPEETSGTEPTTFKDLVLMAARDAVEEDPEDEMEDSSDDIDDAADGEESEVSDPQADAASGPAAEFAAEGEKAR